MSAMAELGQRWYVVVTVVAHFLHRCRFQLRFPNYLVRWKSTTIQNSIKHFLQLFFFSHRCSFFSFPRRWLRRKMLTGREFESVPCDTFSVPTALLEPKLDSRLLCRSAQDSNQQDKMSLTFQCQRCSESLQDRHFLRELRSHALASEIAGTQLAS